ncbi:GIY-YIG nuclease family protein [Streptomyces rubiginosohelvolus]
MSSSKDRRTGLYRLFDKKGRLLYVGIGYDPKVRWARHAALTRWWKDVSEKQVEWFPTRPEAERAERDAIRDETPIYNKKDSAVPYQGSTIKRGLKLPRRIPVADDVWAIYEIVCAESGVTPEEDMTRFIKQRLRRDRAEKRRFAAALRQRAGTV